MAINTIHEFVKALQNYAAQQQAEIAQKVLKGMSDHMEYREEVGRAKGIGHMADAAYQLMKRRDLDDESDDTGLSDMPPDDPPPKASTKGRGNGGRK